GATRTRILAQYDEAVAESKNSYRETRWTIAATLEGDRSEIDAKFNEVQAQVEAQMQQLAALRQEAQRLLQRWKQPTACATRPPPGDDDKGTSRLRKLQECIRDTEACLAALKELFIPRLLPGLRLVWLFLLLFVASLYPAFLIHPVFGIPGAAIATVVLFA